MEYINEGALGYIFLFALVITAIISWGIAELSSRGETSITVKTVAVYALSIFFGGWLFGSIVWYILWFIFIRNNQLF